MQFGTWTVRTLGEDAMSIVWRDAERNLYVQGTYEGNKTSYTHSEAIGKTTANSRYLYQGTHKKHVQWGNSLLLLSPTATLKIMLEPLKTLHIAIIKFNLFNLNYTQKDRPTSWKPNYRYLVVTRKLCSTKGVSLLDNAWWKVLCVVVVFRDQAQGISATAHPPPPAPEGRGRKHESMGFIVSSSYFSTSVAYFIIMSMHVSWSMVF